MDPADKYLARLLLRRSLISAEVLEDWSASGESNLMTWVCRDPLLADEAAGALAESLGLSRFRGEVDGEGLSDLVSRLDAQWALSCAMVPVRREGSRVVIAVSYPWKESDAITVAHQMGISFEPRLATPQEWMDCYQTIYGSESKELSPGSPIFGVEEMSASQPAPEEDSRLSEGGVARFLDNLLGSAAQTMASDIHLEAQESDFRLRFRRDGVLQEVDRIPRHLGDSLVSRIKLLAHMNVSEHRHPQDGHWARGETEFRVSVIPSLNGESVAIRLHISGAGVLSLEALGMSATHQAAYRGLLERGEGLTLVTGPTGSGKTTTLYAGMAKLNTRDRKVVSVEDPVECRIEGINQVEVNPLAGLTFGTALRAILRQAPNVILVGEIRDLETAEIAVQASLTGHSVFSTLHTPDAAGAIIRLKDIGIHDYLVSASLAGVIAQRLVRTIAPGKGIPYQASASDLKLLGLEESPETLEFFRAGAHDRDYQGREGIFEILTINHEFSRRIHQGISRVSMEEYLRKTGHRGMRDDGISKILRGITTLNEIIRVLGIAESGISVLNRFHPSQELLYSDND